MKKKHDVRIDRTKLHPWLDYRLGILLKKCEKKGLSVLIFSHHPLYPQSDFSALNGNEIVDTLSKYSCVKAAFSGHHHAGAFGYYKNIPLITKCLCYRRNFPRSPTCKRARESIFILVQIIPTIGYLLNDSFAWYNG